MVKIDSEEEKEWVYFKELGIGDCFDFHDDKRPPIPLINRRPTMDTPFFKTGDNEFKSLDALITNSKTTYEALQMERVRKWRPPPKRLKF